MVARGDVCVCVCVCVCACVCVWGGTFYNDLNEAGKVQTLLHYCWVELCFITKHKRSVILQHG